LLIRDQQMGELDDLLRQLDALEKSDRGPFPYKGCRWLRAAVQGDYHDLIPCLDIYLSEVAGYRSWGKKILRWPDEKIAAVEARLGQSFFERFPAYSDLQSVLGSPEASDVSEALDNADQTRVMLLRLLSLIRDVKNRRSSNQQ
jgi:hypothetical protein